jgi:hypothetical protein
MRAENCGVAVDELDDVGGVDLGALVAPQDRPSTLISKYSF